MGLLCDYFAAPSDDAAAATIDWTGGPSRPDLGARRALFRREPRAQPYVVIDMKGVEPTVQMATLEEILTDRSYDAIVADSADRIVASRDGGTGIVVRLTKTLQEALADATQAQLAEAVDRWAETDEFWSHGDPAILRPEIDALARLASTAIQEGANLYCWVCL